MSGWISLHRQIREHWLYKKKRKFSHFEAWIDILLEANHKPKKILFDGRLVVIERGTFITSKRKLAKRWRWTREAVLQFFTLLESDSMITQKSSHRCTTVSVINYDTYQHMAATDGATDKATVRPVGVTTNNDNNINNNILINAHPKLTAAFEPEIKIPGKYDTPLVREWLPKVRARIKKSCGRTVDEAWFESQCMHRSAEQLEAALIHTAGLTKATTLYDPPPKAKSRDGPRKSQAELNQDASLEAMKQVLREAAESK